MFQELPRITYNSINVDLGRGWNVFSAEENHLRTGSQALSGVSSFNSFYTETRVVAEARLVSSQVKRELDEWWAYVRNGSTFTFIRDRNLGMYLNFEGKSLLDNDDRDGTFTRTNDAYYVDPDSGLIVEAALGNQERYPAGKFGRGTIIEGARTNLIQYPSNFSTTWTTSNLTVGTDTSDVKDPEGNFNADTLTATADNGRITYTTATTVSTDDGAFSIYLRSSAGDVSCTLSLGDDGPDTFETENITVTPEWQRFDVAHDNTSSSVNNWEVRVIIATNTEFVYAYGAQLEVGSEVLFASTIVDPIREGSTDTRSAEKLTYTLNSNNFDANQGTIGFWFKPVNWIGSTSAGASTCGSSRVFINVNDGTNRFLEIRYGSNASTGFMGFRLHDAEGTLHHDGSPPIAASADWHHIGFTWDAPAGSQTSYFDGALLNNTSINAFAPYLTTDTLHIGLDHNDANHAFAFMDEILIRKDVLTAGQINQIYNRNRGLGIGRNRFGSMIADEYVASERHGDRYDIRLSMREEIT